MKNKLIILSLCLITVFVLSGCRSKKNDNATQVSPVPTSSSAGNNYDGDYHANNNGNIDEDNRTTSPAPNYGTNNGTSGSNTTDNGTSSQGTTDGKSGSRAMDNVNDAVDDLVNNAKNALRRDEK